MHKNMNYNSQYKKIIVFGCGNILFGDDGFGPEVANKLLSENIFSPDVEVIDAGTSVRNMLFDILLSKEKPRYIIIVDICDIGMLPGTIAEIPLSAITPCKTSDFSMHQFPTTNLLKEIMNNTDIAVKILVVQPDNIPMEVNPGLSSYVRQAVLPMCETIKKKIILSNQ